MRFLFRILSVKVILLALVFTVALLYGQHLQPADPIAATTNGLPNDIWFWLFVGYIVFSAVVSGMPEPEPDSSPWYIWAYRTGHTLAAIGTSYFQNKMFWPTSANTKIVLTKGLSEDRHD